MTAKPTNFPEKDILDFPKTIEKSVSKTDIGKSRARLIHTAD